MPGADQNQPLLISVLDRLLDDNPDQATDPVRGRGHTLADLRNAVRRDLEALLNTRHRCLGWPADLTELDSSLVNYGVPDMTSLSLGTEAQRQAFVARIEDVIRRFEPRFQSLTISLLDSAEPTDRTLRFRIEALIYADPAPEPMVFDSVLEPSLRMFSVTSKANG